MASCHLPLSKKPGTPLTFQLWLYVWHLYEDIVLSFFPHRYMDLSHYRRHISDLDQCFHWAAVLSYDAQFWHKCTLHGLPFSAFNQQLYVTILDAAVVKALACRCFCCQHFDYEVIDCPFLPGGPTGEGGDGKEDSTEPAGQENLLSAAAVLQHGRGSSPQLPAIYHQDREICIKYQSGTCSFPNCRRAHMCRHCKQDHPATECRPAGPVTPQSR